MSILTALALRFKSKAKSIAPRCGMSYGKSKNQAHTVRLIFILVID